MTDPTAPTPINMDNGENWGVGTTPMMHPFILGGVLYANIELRQPNGRDIEALFTQDAIKTPDFMRSLSSWPADAWSKMHGADYRTAFKQAAAFLS